MESPLAGSNVGANNLINRRELLVSSFSLLLSGGLLSSAYPLAAARPDPSRPWRDRLSQLGPLQSPDQYGIRLPAGLRAKLLAQSGKPVSGVNGYPWPSAPDGGATFANKDGSWVYVANSEMPQIAAKSGIDVLRRMDAAPSRAV